MKVNNLGFIEKVTSARKGDTKSVYRNWWIVKQHTGRPGGIVNLGTLSLPKRYVGKKIMIKVIDMGVRKRERTKIVWEKLDKITYQNENPKEFDFVITKEGRKYVMDIFDAKIKDSNQAYIETLTNFDLVKMKKEASNYR